MTYPGSNSLGELRKITRVFMEVSKDMGFVCVDLLKDTYPYLLGIYKTLCFNIYDNKQTSVSTFSDPMEYKENIPRKYVDCQGENS